MLVADVKKRVRCAVYTRKSTEDGLEQEYNSLDAQRDAAEAYTLFRGRLPTPDALLEKRGLAA